MDCSVVQGQYIDYYGSISRLRDLSFKGDMTTVGVRFTVTSVHFGLSSYVDVWKSGVSH